MALTTDDVRRRMAQILEIPEERATPDTVLTDLVSDSFRLVEMAIELQEDFDVIIGQADMVDLRTVAQLAELVRSRVVVP
ncbi:MAG: acyl carrier protein [Actinomycetota bacterium]|nr:acyl carrier protein [Actinomycetota bacterium]